MNKTRTSCVWSLPRPTWIHITHDMGTGTPLKLSMPWHNIFANSTTRTRQLLDAQEWFFSPGFLIPKPKGGRTTPYWVGCWGWRLWRHRIGSDTWERQRRQARFPITWYLLLFVCFTNQPHPPTHPHPLSPNKKAFHKLQTLSLAQTDHSKERAMAMAAMALRNRLSSSSSSSISISFINNSIRPFVNHLVLSTSFHFSNFYFTRQYFLNVPFPIILLIRFHFRLQSSLANQALQDKEKSRATVSHFLFTLFRSKLI